MSLSQCVTNLAQKQIDSLIGQIASSVNSASAMKSLKSKFGSLKDTVTEALPGSKGGVSFIDEIKKLQSAAAKGGAQYAEALAKFTRAWQGVVENLDDYIINILHLDACKDVPNIEGTPGADGIFSSARTKATPSSLPTRNPDSVDIIAAPPVSMANKPPGWDNSAEKYKAFMKEYNALVSTSIAPLPAVSTENPSFASLTGKAEAARMPLEPFFRQNQTNLSPGEREAFSTNLGTQKEAVAIRKVNAKILTISNSFLVKVATTSTPVDALSAVNSSYIYSEANNVPEQFRGKFTSSLEKIQALVETNSTTVRDYYVLSGRATYAGGTVLGTIEGCVITQDRGVVSYIAKAAIDNDGSDNRQRDPYWQPETAVQHRGRPIDAESVPYIAVPPLIIKKAVGKIRGARVRVTNLNTGQSVEAVVADVGPQAKLGEVSCEAARRIGLSGNPNNGGTLKKIIKYEIFAGVPAVVDGITYSLS